MPEIHKPQNKNEKLGSPSDSKEQIESIKSKLEKNVESSEKHSSKEIKETRKTIESEAISAEDERPGNGEKNVNQASITKAEKTRTYKMTMNRMQNQLPAPSRTFSKFIHNPVVEKSSAVVGSTVARPSGILGAGVVGFLGIAAVMYLARKNGFEITNSYTLVALLFVGGWALGMILELLLKLVRRTR